MACKEEHRLKSWYIKSRRTTGVGKSFAAEGKQEEEEEEGEEVVLNAGEVLFIPSFTFHQVHPISFSSSINIFTSTEYSDTFKALREVCGGYTRILFLFFFVFQKYCISIHSRTAEGVPRGIILSAHSLEVALFYLIQFMLTCCAYSMNLSYVKGRDTLCTSTVRSNY